jgi:hypothetical protein
LYNNLCRGHNAIVFVKENYQKAWNVLFFSAGEIKQTLPQFVAFNKRKKKYGVGEISAPTPYFKL